MQLHSFFSSSYGEFLDIRITGLPVDPPMQFLLYLFRHTTIALWWGTNHLVEEVSAWVHLNPETVCLRWERNRHSNRNKQPWHVLPGDRRQNITCHHRTRPVTIWSCICFFLCCPTPMRRISSSLHQVIPRLIFRLLSWRYPVSSVREALM